ncbi:hypothetical protein [Sphingobacterium sp.]|uniref:hypothetical protein n=1 Tax=Sphingobacterium sp. TaxID=341027 RepID=UPI002FDDC580
MAHRVKPKLDHEEIQVNYANWAAQTCGLMKPKNLYLIGGRGTTKTTEIQAERIADMVYELPGAPVAWIADVYTNLEKNILPALEQGLKRKNLIEGIHYIRGNKIPKYSRSQKEKLPAWLKDHFWNPVNEIGKTPQILIFFTGFNITFGSMDKPSSLAGGSFVHFFGDEVKYFGKKKVAPMLKASRGYRELYGHSPYYRGKTFTTDMPDINNIGEEDWILNYVDEMDVDGMEKLMEVSLIRNEALQEQVRYEQEGNVTEAAKKKKTFERWNERWHEMRRKPECQTLFMVNSSYVNIDILSPEYMEDALADDMGDVEPALLSIEPKVKANVRFYSQLSAIHFYQDGLDTVWAERFNFINKADCRELKYLDLNSPIDIGVDFGNMISLVIGQHEVAKNIYRLLKFMYVIPKEWIPELAAKFKEYFEPHRNKTIYYYYDRSGNNYQKQGVDHASELAHAIEFNIDDNGKEVPSGWRVIPMSKTQGIIPQQEEHSFMQKIMSGAVQGLPTLLIDFWQCKEIRLSMELTRTIYVTNKAGVKQIKKKKTSEKLPAEKLPTESTNPSDAAKYILMRPLWRDIAKRYNTSNVGTASVRK